MLEYIKTNKIAIISITSLLIVVGILIAIICKQVVTINQKNIQISAITDTVHQYITKDHKNAAYIQTIVGSRNDLIAIAKQKDSTIYKLLKSNKNITDISAITSSTKIDTTTKTDTNYIAVKQSTEDSTGKVTIVEHQIKPDSIYIAKHIDNPWYTADINIVNNSTKLKLEVINKFSVTHEYKSNGLFKPKSLVVDVVNDNPYTKTTGLSSYQLSQPKNKFLPGLITGGLATTLLLILIHK